MRYFFLTFLLCLPADAGCGEVMTRVYRRLLLDPPPHMFLVEAMRRAIDGDPELENFRRIASALDGLTAEDMERSVRVYLDLSQPDRIRFAEHLVRLVRSGLVDDARLVVRLLPHWSSLYASLSEVTPHPQVVTALAGARSRWRNARDRVLGHIAGDELRVDTMTSPLHRLAGGGHTIEGHERLLRLRFEGRRRSDAAFNAVAERLIEGARVAVARDRAAIAELRNLRDMGFSNTAESYVWHSHFGDLRGSHREVSNGVVRLLLDRSMLLSDGWTNTVRSSVEAMSPPGGKTLFPPDWNAHRIERAILRVLGSRNSVIVNPRGIGGNYLRFYVRGEVDGVFLLVGIHQTGPGLYEVGSAFPAWRQRLPHSVESISRLHEQNEERAFSAVLTLNRRYVATHEITLDQAVQFFTGKKPSIPEPDYTILARWFDPARLGELTGEEGTYARATQTVLFDYLESRRLMREFARRVL